MNSITRHIFQPTVGQTLPRYGNPANLPKHIQPTYPDITHADAPALRTVFDKIHTQANRPNLRTSDIKNLKHALKICLPETVGHGAQVAALTLATANQVTVVDAKGVPEAGKILTETLRLLRHRLGVDSETYAGRIAENLGRREMGTKIDLRELPRTLGNSLIGLSFGAELLTQEKVDKNIEAFHMVLTRNDGVKPGLGGQYKQQLPVIETMLTIGAADKMARCHRLAITWIRDNTSHLDLADSMRLAKTCIKHYAKITSLPASDKKYGALHRLMKGLDITSKRELSDFIHRTKSKFEPGSSAFRAFELLEKNDAYLDHFRREREAASGARFGDDQSEGSMPRQLREDYNTLSLSPDATNEELKRQYRKLALQYHPDMLQRNHRDVEEGKATFQKIGDAYDRINVSRGLVADYMQSP